MTYTCIRYTNDERDTMTETLTEEPQHELDPTTGLPALPEGYWWEVREESRVYYNPSPRYVVAIKHMVTTPEHSVDDESFWGFIFMVKRVVPEATKPEYECSSAVYDEDGLDVTYLTPELVLKTAQKVLTNWNTFKDLVVKRAQSEALLGDYPPKSL